MWLYMFCEIFFSGIIICFVIELVATVAERPWPAASRSVLFLIYFYIDMISPSRGDALSHSIMSFIIDSTFKRVRPEKESMDQKLEKEETQLFKLASWLHVPLLAFLYGLFLG